MGVVCFRAGFWIGRFRFGVSARVCSLDDLCTDTIAGADIDHGKRPIGPLWDDGTGNGNAVLAQKRGSRKTCGAGNRSVGSGSGYSNKSGGERYFLHGLSCEKQEKLRA